MDIDLMPLTYPSVGGIVIAFNISRHTSDSGGQLPKRGCNSVSHSYVVPGYGLNLNMPVTIHNTLSFTNSKLIIRGLSTQ